MRELSTFPLEIGLLLVVFLKICTEIPVNLPLLFNKKKKMHFENYFNSSASFIKFWRFKVRIYF
jgi:hypothetical protein